MNNNKQPLTEKQKQAAIVCGLCALALIITICMTAVQVTKASKAANEDSSSSSSSTSNTTGYTGEDYIIDATANSAVLTETEDMGDEYLEETLFIGDSNTVRFYNNGLLSTQQYIALEGLTIQSALTERFVTFKSDDNYYTIAEAVAMMKPRRVIITLGTNNADGSMSTEAFVSAYEDLIDAILDSYEYTDIIINAIPPVTESQTSYPDLSQETIDDMNMALAEFALEAGYKFLNSAEALKDSSGYGDEDYYVSNDIHLKASGLNAILSYVTTHAYIAEDRRPDTDDIAQRTSSSVSSSGTSSSSSSSSSTTTTTYTAKYFVDTAGGGTLTSGDDTDNVNLSFDIDEDTNSVTVTAVPDDGYAFVKWSDGVTTATRTDSDFTQNVNVTAMFGTVGISITLNTAESAVKAGASIEFEATITGGYASLNDVVWYINDEVNAASAAGKSWLTVEEYTNYTIYATITYNGVTATSAAITIEQEQLVTVPDITSMTESAAKAALASAGLSSGTITYQEAIEGNFGTVTFQATTAGSQVVEGSSINFTVLTEATTYTVPNLVGMTIDQAKAALTAAGFTGSVDTSKTEYSSSIAADSVTSQSPSAGSKATADTSFVLTISLGKAPVTVTDVTKMTQATATTTLENQGFSVKVVTAYSTTVAEGNVISYTPSGSQSYGSTITITVSLGVEPAASSETTDDNEEEDEEVTE